MMKRLADLLIASTLLVLLSPLILVVALAVGATMGRPVLIGQIRCGQWARPFRLYKFRSMTEQRDAQGHLLADELRLTETGKFIRRYSLDELPQLVNVIKGDMSLVGPRPLLMDYVALYTPTQARRLHVKPGITGWAQVNGRNSIGWDQKLGLDVWYVDNRSFLVDLKILFLTARKVLRCDGISQDGHATAERFRGSAE